MKTNERILRLIQTYEPYSDNYAGQKEATALEYATQMNE